MQLVASKTFYGVGVSRYELQIAPRDWLLLFANTIFAGPTLSEVQIHSPEWRKRGIENGGSPPFAPPVIVVLNIDETLNVENPDYIFLGSVYNRYTNWRPV